MILPWVCRLSGWSFEPGTVSTLYKWILVGTRIGVPSVLVSVLDWICQSLEVYPSCLFEEQRIRNWSFVHFYHKGALRIRPYVWRVKIILFLFICLVCFYKNIPLILNWFIFQCLVMSSVSWWQLINFFYCPLVDARLFIVKNISD